MKTLLLFLFPLLSFAQISMSADPLGGTPLTGGLYPEIKGSQYLYEDWNSGTVILQNGENWANWDLKVDLYSKTVIYKDQEGQLKQIVKPISTIQFADEALPAIIFLNHQIYQVIAKGDISLLKRVFKVVVENKDYTSSSTTKNFITNSEYFVYTKNGGLTRTNLSKAGLSKALPEQKEAIARFVKNHSLKSEKDLSLLFEELNRL